MDSNERKILVFTSFGHFLCHLYMLVFPVLLLPITRALGMPMEEVLPKSFLMYLLYGILAMPWGFLSDHYNPRVVLAVGVILAGAGFCTTAITHNSSLLPLSLALVGVGCAAYHPAGLSMLSKGLRSRGRGMGINGLFGNLGIAGAPFAAGSLNYAFGWRPTLLIFGGIGIAIGIVCLIIPFTVKRGEDLQKSSEIRHSHLLKLFITICVVMTFSGLMYRGFTLILPSYMEMRLADTFEQLYRDLSTAESAIMTAGRGSLFAAIIAGMAYLVGMGGQIIGGRIADRGNLKVVYVAYFVAALPFLLALRFATGISLAIFAGMFAFFTIGIQPIENSMYAMLTPPRWRSVAYGLKFTLAFGVGSLSVFFVNRVEQRWGLAAVVLLLVCYLGAVILAAVLFNILGRGQEIRHAHDAPAAVSSGK